MRPRYRTASRSRSDWRSERGRRPRPGQRWWRGRSPSAVTASCIVCIVSLSKLTPPACSCASIAGSMPTIEYIGVRRSQLVTLCQPRETVVSRWSRRDGAERIVGHRSRHGVSWLACAAAGEAVGPVRRPSRSRTGNPHQRLPLMPRSAASSGHSISGCGRSAWPRYLETRDRGSYVVPSSIEFAPGCPSPPSVSVSSSSACRASYSSSGMPGG